MNFVLTFHQAGQFNDGANTQFRHAVFALFLDRARADIALPRNGLG
jgi:hypothetical protein